MLRNTLIAATPLIALLAACNGITGVNDLSVDYGPSGSGAASGNGGGAGSGTGAGTTGAGASTSGTTGVGAGMTTTTGTTVTGPTQGPATGVTITQIAIYQGPKRILMGGTQTGTVTVPVVAGRDALVRVFVQTDATYDGGPVTADLYLGTAPTPIEVVGPVNGSPSEATIGSTINFNVPGASIVPGVTYRVALTEATSKDPNAGASYPANGALDPLGSASDGPQLKVVVVPVEYGADGSNRVPDTATLLPNFKNAFMGTYPVANIDLTVGSPFPWTSAVSANGTGWSELLSAIADARQQANVAPDVYWFGAFMPASSFDGYCGGGCVAGLGIIGSTGDTYSRAAIGLGFVDPTSYTTIIHEIGHTQGRQHAPCGGASNPDPAFPYANGDVGDWGYDLVTKTLYQPGHASDMMGYCDPVWISDYTFNAIFQEMKTVNGAEIIYPANMLNRIWERALVDMNDNLQWLPSITLPTPPSGQSTPVTVQSAGGSAAITGQFFPYDHIPGGILLWPEGSSPANSVAVSLGGQLKTLSH